MEVTQLEPYILKGQWRPSQDVGRSPCGNLVEVYELTNRIPGSIKVIDRFFSVPVDYAKPDGPHIRIFVRNLIPLGESGTDAAESDLPYRMSFLILSSIACTIFSRENQSCICKVTRHGSNNCDQRLIPASCRWSRVRC